MPVSLTLDLSVKMASDEGTVKIDDLYRAFDVNGVNNRIVSIAAGATLTIDLTVNPSTYFIIVGDGEGSLEITVTNSTDQSTKFTGSDFVCLHSTNLKTVAIKNTASAAVEIPIYY